MVKGKTAEMISVQRKKPRQKSKESDGEMKKIIKDLFVKRR